MPPKERNEVVNIFPRHQLTAGVYSFSAVAKYNKIDLLTIQIHKIVYTELTVIASWIRNKILPKESGLISILFPLHIMATAG